MSTEQKKKLVFFSRQYDYFQNLIKYNYTNKIELSGPSNKTKKEMLRLN